MLFLTVENIYLSMELRYYDGNTVAMQSIICYVIIYT